MIYQNDLNDDYKVILLLKNPVNNDNQKIVSKYEYFEMNISDQSYKKIKKYIIKKHGLKDQLGEIK